MTGATGATGALPARSELDPAYTWNLESIFPSDAAWESRFAELAGRLDELDSLRDSIGASAETFLAALRRRDALLLEIEHVRQYAGLRAAEDQTNAHYVAMQDRANGLTSRANAAVAWYEPALLALGEQAIATYLDDNTELAVYGHYFETLFRRQAHVRSQEVEQVLALADEPLDGFDATWRALNNADLTFEPFEDEAGQTTRLQQNGQYRYLLSSDRRVRQAVWERYYDAYLRLRNTFAANYAGEVKRSVFNARARGHASALDAALAGPNLPPAIYYNLLDALASNVGVWQRFFRVQAKLLGVDRLHGWDLSEQPLELPGRSTRRFSFDEAVALILDALAPMGEEYVGIVRQGIADRWVDVYSNVGKTGGAFSSGAPGTHPFILLNFMGQLGTTSTLAHELGHSMHSYYAWRAQPAVYAWYGDVVGETASNLHQVLLADHIMKHSDDPDLQLEVIQERMGGHLRYLFNMVLLARFELDCHQQVERGEALTADEMIATMADLYADAYGDSVVLDRERTGIRWATLPHLFQPFYVYSYGAGTAAAYAIGTQIIEAGQPAAERALAMFAAGDSIDQHEALRLGGADLRDPAVYQSAFDVLAGYVDRLEDLL
ncbi:MAG TPA: M3 family oligoendopeptidase [Thermomicrobiales bacterium]|nr:M3 family oligoendopeptidase [Thermomicrobiales bacterium]